MFWTAEFVGYHKIKIKSPDKRIAFVGTLEEFGMWLTRQFPDGKEPQIELVRK